MTAKEKSKKAEVAPLWRRHLICSEEGRAKPLLANALTALREAPEWHGVLGFDEFAQKLAVRSPPPWVREDSEGRGEWGPANDALTAVWLQRHGILVGPDIAGQAVDVAARDHRFIRCGTTLSVSIGTAGRGSSDGR